MLDALCSYQFLQYAALACLLSGILGGICGVIVIEKRLVMMSGGIAHTAYGGVGLGYLLGFEPLLGAIGFSLGAAFGIGALQKKGRQNADVPTAIFWSVGMALGVLFIGIMPGYPPDVNSYLFGNILTVSAKDLYLLLGITLLFLIFLWVLYDDLLATLFDAEFARVSGVHTAVIEYAILVLVALSVVALIRVAGIIMMLAQLTLPAACSAQLTKKLSTRLLLSAVYGVVFSLAGLILSYYINISSGAVIVLLSAGVYLLLLLSKKATKNG